MAPGDDQTKPSTRELAELSALADGTLDPSRRADVRARVAASPELSALYARERTVVAALHEARATERAPARLRARVQQGRPTPHAAARRRVTYAGGLAGALAAVALALVLALPSGTPGSPTVSDAAALAVRGASAPAPAPDPSHPAAQLNRSVGAVYFPNWTSALGWQAVGERTDRLGGRTAVTVYYRWEGSPARIAYTIVAAPALAEPAGQRTWRDGTELRTLTIHGRTVVTWERAGDTCVLSGTGITADVLQTLAAWKVPADGR
jgi:anti-sigma factor RsiW